jgi:hypothetical protein
MKNIIILFIYDGSPEIDWILPLMHKLKKDYKIFTYFQSQKSFQNLKSNKELFSLWEEVTDKYYIQKYLDNFIWKVLFKISKFIKIKDITFNKYLILKINNAKKLKIKLKKIFKVKDLKVKFIFSSFSKNSGWTLSYKSIFKESKLIHYPDSTWNYCLKNKNKILPHTFKLRGDILLLANKETIPFCKNLIDRKKIIVCGTPKYDSFWKEMLLKNSLKNLDFRYNLVKKKYLITFAYTSFFNLYKNVNHKLHTQLFDIMSSILKFKDVVLIFKIHPRANTNIYLETLNKFDNSKWIISKNHIINLASISKCFLHTPLTSTVTDALFMGLPTIEIWNPTRDIYSNERKIFYDENLTNKIKNGDQLKNFLKKIKYKKKKDLLKKKFDRFKKIYRPNSNSANFIIKKINNV